MNHIIDLTVEIAVTVKFIFLIETINFFHSTGTLLTAALLMRATDRQKNHSESLELLEKLKKYDSNRIGYYTDLANKWSIENCLANWISAVQINRDTPIDLSQMNLINLHYKQYLSVAAHINLTANKFDAQRINEISAWLKACNVTFTLDTPSDP